MDLFSFIRGDSLREITAFLYPGGTGNSEDGEGEEELAEEENQIYREGGVMVLVDGSPHSQRALDKAIEAVGQGETLHIVHLVELYQEDFFQEGLKQQFKEVPGQLLDQLTAHGNSLLERCKEHAVNKGIRSSNAVVLSSLEPKSEAIRYASLHGIRIIFVGARGLTLAKRMLIGSMSKYISRYASCDVIVVR